MAKEIGDVIEQEEFKDGEIVKVRREIIDIYEDENGRRNIITKSVE